MDERASRMVKWSHASVGLPNEATPRETVCNGPGGRNPGILTSHLRSNRGERICANYGTSSVNQELDFIICS